jgi:hypothetical protein
MSNIIKTHVGDAQTSVHHPTGAEEVVNEKVGEGKLEANKAMCVPSIRYGQTINTGNYNSVRIEIGLSVPCEHGELEEVYDFILGWIDDKASALVEVVKSQYGVS